MLLVSVSNQENARGIAKILIIFIYFIYIYIFFIIWSMEMFFKQIGGERYKKKVHL